MKRAAIVTIAVTLAALLAGCDNGRECVKRETKLQYVSTIGSKGQLTWSWQPRSVCVEYAPDFR